MDKFTPDMRTPSYVRVRDAVVVDIIARRPDATEALADLGSSSPEPVISYHGLTGPLYVGDRVTLNTTAGTLRLGTGGVHFVIAIHGREMNADVPGHIMKLRYTPAQVKVLTVEEEESAYHDQLQQIPDLGGKPVLVGSLHSQLPIVAAVIRSQVPDAKIAYIMTDGAALPAALSRLIFQLRESQLIHAFFTAGHAFGGDYEAVSSLSAMAAAHVVTDADAIIVAMGPGVVGTSTPLGTTALEQGPLLDAAHALGATAVPIVRASGVDTRHRHRGISHHTMTALTRFTFHPTTIPLSRAPTVELTEHIEKQSKRLRQHGHIPQWEDGRTAYAQARALLESYGITVTSMGRTSSDDPLFFWMAAAAGFFGARLIHS